MEKIKRLLFLFFQFRVIYDIQKIQHPSENTITVINRKHPDMNRKFGINSMRMKR